MRVEEITKFPFIPTLPTSDAEKFIGPCATNLALYTEEDEKRRRTYYSAYDIIDMLGLKFGDPQTTVVRATFSRLAQIEIIRALGDPNFSLPPAGQPLAIPEDLRTRVSEGLKKLTRRGRKIPVNQTSFVDVFAAELANQGMPELAARLNQSTQTIAAAA